VWGTLCLFLFSLLHLGVHSSDDATMLAAAGALWDRHTLAIPEMEWLDERVDIGRRGPDGLLYPKYGLGQTLTAGALYGVGKTLFPDTQPFTWTGYPIVDSGSGAALAQLMNVFLGSLVVALAVYETANRFGEAAATATGLMLALASPLWSTARGFGSEIGAGLGILLATISARRALRPESPSSVWRSVAWLGMATLFRPSALAFGVAWPIWLWRRPRREWIATGIAFAVVIASLAGYNWLRYGALFESGYGDAGSGFCLQVTGLIGYLVAPGRGLLVFAPWALLAIPAAIRVLRARRMGEMGVLAGVAGFYLIHSMWCEWEGGWSYGPRLIVPLLPIVALGVVDFFSDYPWLSLLLLPASLIQVAALAADPIVTYYKAVFESGATLEQTVWSVADSITLHQLRAAATPEHFVWLVVWATMALAWLGLGVRRKAG